MQDSTDMDNHQQISIEDKERLFDTKEGKAEILGLDEKQINALKTEKPEPFDGDINLDNYDIPTTYEHIDINKIVGYGSHEPNTWYDALDCSVCHKHLSFDLYDSSKFPEYIDSEEEHKHDMPSVIEKDGKYFIYGGGTHRLTIAKVTGCKKAYVAIHRKSQQ